MIQGIDYLSEKFDSYFEKVTYADYTMRLIKTNLTGFYSVAQAASDKFGDKEFLISEEGEKLSFTGLLELVDRYAGYLKYTNNIQAEDQVGILLMNSFEFCVSVLALNKIGATCVLFSTKLKAQGILTLIKNVSLKLFLYDNELKSEITGEDFGELVTEECNFSDQEFMTKITENGKDFEADQELDRVALLMFTSGTTGKNKRVPLKNYNVVQAILAYENALDLSPDDSTIVATPIYYVTGLIALFGLFLKVGGKVYLRRRFHVEEIIQLTLEKNITLIHGSPVVFNLILGQRPTTPAMDSLRYFLCGSGPMSVEKINEIDQWLPNVEFRTVYGLTETSSPLTIMDEAVARSKHKGASGRPVATADVRIVGDDGTDLGAEKIGNVEVRGATVIRSYYNNENPELFSPGSWLQTGDIGYVSEQGYLYVLDRKKDMINVGGEKVAGSSVEDQIYALGIADEVAVVAVEDELFGEVVGAMIVYKENQEVPAEKLQQLLGSRIPKYQIPKVILQVSEIPKNENMKLDKVKVRQILNDYKREHE